MKSLTAIFAHARTAKPSLINKTKWKRLFIKRILFRQTSSSKNYNELSSHDKIYDISEQMTSVGSPIDFFDF